MIREKKANQQALASTIYFLRRRYNIKRQYLAKALGVSTATIDKMEQGKICPRFTDVFDLCQAIGASLEELATVYESERRRLHRQISPEDSHAAA
jgi:DNA-binding XRE family transcriptional regulator